MTDKTTARKAVLVGLLVLTIVSIYKDRKGTSSAGQAGSFRVLWGVGVVGMFLSLLADFVPQIAGPFAGLIALGSMTNGGDQILAKALGVIGPPPSSSPSPSSGSTTSGGRTAATTTVQTQVHG